MNLDDCFIDEILDRVNRCYVLDPSGRNLEWVCIDDGPFKTRWDYDNQKVVERVPRYKNSFYVSEFPYASVAGGYFQLKQYLREWLNEKQYRYQIDYRYCGMKIGWYVGFLDSNQAMLFKLTWGLGAIV